MAACAYLVSRYPTITHTFVFDEVRALRRAGVRVETATIRRVDRTELLSAEAREEDARTFAIRPVGAGRFLRVHLRALSRAPGAYARTLLGAVRSAHAGGRPRLW